MRVIYKDIKWALNNKRYIEEVKQHKEELDQKMEERDLIFKKMLRLLEKNLDNY